LTKKAPCLPTEMHVPETGFPENASWLIFGAPKIGKTDFASQWPNTLIIELEPNGARYVEGAYVVGPEDSDFPIKSINDLRKLAALLTKEYNSGKRPFDTIAIDVIDVVNEFAEADTKADLNISEMGQAPFGQDWGTSRTTVLSVIKGFSTLPVSLLILAHSKWAIVDDIVVGHTIDLPGKLGRFAQAAVENIIYIAQKEDGEREMIFKPVPSVEAGSRNPLLAKIGSCSYGYAELAKLFEKTQEEE